MLIGHWISLTWILNNQMPVVWIELSIALLDLDKSYLWWRVTKIPNSIVAAHLMVRTLFEFLLRHDPDHQQRPLFFLFCKNITKLIVFMSDLANDFILCLTHFPFVYVESVVSIDSGLVTRHGLIGVDCNFNGFTWGNDTERFWISGRGGCRKKDLVGS